MNSTFNDQFVEQVRDRTAQWAVGFCEALSAKVDEANKSLEGASTISLVSLPNPIGRLESGDLVQTYRRHFYSTTSRQKVPGENSGTDAEYIDDLVYRAQHFVRTSGAKKVVIAVFISAQQTLQSGVSPFFDALVATEL